VIKAQPEQFIGHEQMTMLGTESWADFEKRIKELEAKRAAEAQAAGGMTAPVPAHQPAPAPEEAPEEATGAVPVEPEPKDDEGLDDDSLPDEYEG